PQFEVDTPYIVAIVKGTKFTTTVSDAGASVKVSEGVVGVSATSGGASIDLNAGGSASVSAAHRDRVAPGGLTGDAGPASGHGKESTLVVAASSPRVGADVDAGGGLSGGADDVSTGATARAGQGGSHPGGNGHGNSRDDDVREAIGTPVRNGGGQGG